MYNYPKTLQIVVRDARSSQILSKSPYLKAPNLKKSPNLKEQMYSPSRKSNEIPLNRVRFPVEGSVLTTPLTYCIHRENYWDIFIVSSLDTHKVFFKHSLKGEVFRKFIPQVIQYGLFVPVKKHTVLVLLPENIIGTALKNQQTDIEAPHEYPLTMAYINCLEQPDASPLRFCNELITYHRCKRTFKEYFYAHRLLMLAIQDVTIARRTDHDGEHLKWFDSLYQAGRELHLTNQAERNALKTLLSEAEQFGVIKDAALILSAHEMTTEYRAQHSIVLNLGKELFNRLVRLEDSPSSLADSFQHYKQVQNVTQLVVVALNVIPFVGGLIAAAVSAGAEVFEGIAIGELVEFGLETQNEVIMGSQTMENVLLRYASDRLESDKLDEMDVQAHEDLTSHLSSCGATPELLRILFRNGSQQRFIHPSQIGLPSSMSPTSFGEIDVDDNGNLGALVDSRYECETGHHEDARNEDSETLYSNDNKNLKICNKEHQANYDHVRSGKDVAALSAGGPSRQLDFSTWSLEELEDFEISQANVQSLKRKNAPILMAAYICGYEPDETTRFETLKYVLYKSLSFSNINGLVISNRSVVSVSSLTKIIVDYIRNNYHELCEDVLLKGRINAFVKEASG